MCALKMRFLSMWQVEARFIFSVAVRKEAKTGKAVPNSKLGL